MKREEKQNMWQLFSCPKQTLVSNRGMFQMFVWVLDLKWMFLEIGWLRDIGILALISWHSHIIYHKPVSLTFSYTPPHTQIHTLCCSFQRQDMNVSVPPQQFSFNGPPDNLMFSSVLLVWPLAQSLLQLSTKTQDLSHLSGGGSCKGKRKIRARLLCYALNLELVPSFFRCLVYLHTVPRLALLTKKKLCWQVLSLFCCFWLLLSLKPKWWCFQAPCFYPSYLLIAIFFAVLTKLAGCFCCLFYRAARFFFILLIWTFASDVRIIL